MQNGIPSKKFDVWRRLYERFLLEPDPAGGPRAAVSTTIQPVTDVDAIVAQASAKGLAFDLTATSGSLRGYTVPENERWRPGLLWREATTGSTHMVIELRQADGTQISVTLTANQTGEQFLDVRGLILDRGDFIGFVTTGNAGDGTRVFQMELQIEERN